MAWFRFYDEVLDDPKVQHLPAETFRRWINLLCLTKRNGGVLPGVPDIAFGLRLHEDIINDLIKELKGFGLLDETETGLKPHNWNGRQYKSDVSTGRVKRFRKRRETVSENDIETPRARQNRTEADTETEADKKVVVPAKPTPAPKEAADAKPKPTKRGTRLPKNWEPDSADIKFALDRGYNLLQIERLADGLRANSADKGTTSKDWHARWHMWVLRDLDFHGPPGSRRTDHGKADAGDRGFTAAAARFAANVETGGNGVGGPDGVPGDGNSGGQGRDQESDSGHHDDAPGEGDLQGTGEVERADETP